MQEEDSEGSKTPNIPLEEEALVFLRVIFSYTKVLATGVGGIKGDGEIAKLFKQNSELQYATIFCFKAIGACLEQAKDTLEGKDPLIPLFWKNLIYLRNTLIHHSLGLLLPDDCLIILAKITQNAGQIYKYFSKVCDKKNTNVDLEGQRYKVFIDVHELSKILQEKYSREVRERKPQQEYLDLIRKLIGVLTKITAGIELTESGLRELKRVNPVKYYAIQNCLEFIATLANPSPEFTVLTKESRQKIIGIHKDADMWFRALGDSRMKAMHENSGVIGDEELVENIENIRRIAMILRPKAAAEPGNVAVLPSAPATSPTKMVKSLGSPLQISAKKPAKAPLQKNSSAKSDTIKQPVGIVPPKISKGSSNIANVPKKGPSKK